MIQHNTILAYQYQAECIVCHATEVSERFFGEACNETRDLFVKHLQKRGWNVAPLLCSGCRNRLVLATVEEALLKGGASK
jgi:hypothetical protein